MHHRYLMIFFRLKSILLRYLILRTRCSCVYIVFELVCKINDVMYVHQPFSTGKNDELNLLIVESIHRSIDYPPPQ